MNLAPNIYRPGVVAGFTLGLATGLVPALSIGALFAQGALWLPASPPAVPAAPASALRYLAYNSNSGLYWTANAAGNNAGDAVLGWAETNATTLIAVSNQVIATASSSSSSTGNSSGSVSTSTSDSQPVINLACHETPTGSLDGVNKVFHLASFPAKNSLFLALNGVLQALGVDFTLTDNVITFTVAPKIDDWLQAWYQAQA